MTEQPRKLSLKPKHDTITGTGSGEIKRSRKRIIKRDQLPASKLATTKKPPPKPQPKRQPAPQPKAPTTPPSDTRAANLNASLSTAFAVWREHQPLALGIEQQVFQFIAANHLSASKRVVQKLLRRHAHDRRYLQAVQAGQYRYNLDGAQAGEITGVEREHAARVIK